MYFSSWQHKPRRAICKAWFPPPNIYNCSPETHRQHGRRTRAPSVPSAKTQAFTESSHRDPCDETIPCGHIHKRRGLDKKMLSTIYTNINFLYPGPVSCFQRWSPLFHPSLYCKYLIGRTEVRLDQPQHVLITATRKQADNGLVSTLCGRVS